VKGEESLNTEHSVHSYGTSRTRNGEICKCGTSFMWCFAYV